jgi:DNA-binding NtrC family response regulator
VNCGALPESLVESELFGCERGAYTDARQGRLGLAAAADSGTLFLDEVDALPARAQVAMLRFLQDKVYRPVGSVREQRSDARIVAAASPRLRELVRSGGFRDDLAYRLNVMPLEVPPLRERHGDVPLLVAHFVARHAQQFGIGRRSLDALSQHWAEQYAWPGNIRELDNVVQRAMLLSDGEGLDLKPHLASLDASAQGPAHQAHPQPARPEPEPAPPAAAHSAPVSYREARERALQAFERQYLAGLMHVAVGNVTHAARLACKERRAFGKLLKKHGIERAGFGAGVTK